MRKSAPPPVPPKPKVSPSSVKRFVIRDSGISVGTISPCKSDGSSPKPVTPSSVKKLASQFVQLAQNLERSPVVVRKPIPPKVPPKPVRNGAKVVQLAEECEVGLLEVDDYDENIYDDVFVSDCGDSDDEVDEGFYAPVAIEEEPSTPPPAGPRNAVEELLQNERKYVARLGEYASRLIPLMYQPNLPQGLRCQKNNVFANIEEIIKLHRDVFLPRLEQCEGCAEQIANLLVELIESEHMYCYVLYALNKHRSERICEMNVDYLQNTLLDLNKFLVEPIQRLPRYRLLLIEIYKETLRANDKNKQQAAALCIAEGKLGALIELVDAAVSLSDILPSPDLDAGSPGLQTPSYHQDMPLTLILRPQQSKTALPKNPINLLYQGKLESFTDVDLYDCSERRKYPAKIFVFEKLLLYTERKSRLEYRGHYFDCELNYDGTESRHKLLLFSKHRGNQELQVLSPSGDSAAAASLQRLVERVARMRENHVYYQAVEFIADREITRRRSLEAERVLRDELEHQGEEEEKPVGHAVWNVYSHMQSLVTGQQQFCQVLQANHDFYLPQDSNETRSRPSSAVETFNRMYSLHLNRILPDLAQCNDPMQLCDLFSSYLKVADKQAEVLSTVYFEYLREFKKAISTISVHRTPATFNSLVAPKAIDFAYLCLDHLEEYCRFFEKLSDRLAEDSSANIPIDMELFRQLAITQAELNKFVANVKQNYWLFRLDDRAVECGLVKYSELVTLQCEDHDRSCRLFISERAAICVGVQTIVENECSTERYSKVIFIDSFSGRANPMRLRKSKKTDFRLNFVIDDVKFKVFFNNRLTKDRFYEKYIDHFVLVK